MSNIVCFKQYPEILQGNHDRNSNWRLGLIFERVFFKSLSMDILYWIHRESRKLLPILICPGNALMV